MFLIKSLKRYSYPVLIWRRTMNTNFLQTIQSSIPALDGSNHKGQAGRIGVVGGSFEYTGAPYFAGISALKVGADLVHIFCASSAATVIKSYSPELIVHPLLDHPNACSEITPWLDRLHVLVIGPGLGREARTLKIVSDLISITKEKKIPLVIDADGLYLITENPDVIKNYPEPGVILTPNKIEYERLHQKININNEIDLGIFGGNVSILRKGSADQFFSINDNDNWQLNSGGSGRRCGGQGDLLSGSIATFFNWTLSNKTVTCKTTAASLACYAASTMVRLCNEKAFKKKGRSMLATDMVEYIHDSFEHLFNQ